MSLSMRRKLQIKDKLPIQANGPRSLCSFPEGQQTPCIYANVKVKMNGDNSFTHRFKGVLKNCPARS